MNARSDVGRAPNEQPLTLLCVSHLNWDHVWQRPQQLMSRFARSCRVIYVDPPMIIKGTGDALLWEQQGAAGVRVLRPLFGEGRVHAPGKPYHHYHHIWSNLFEDVLAAAGSNSILWVFSPHADLLIEQARPKIRLAVYDCMDDLASFRTGMEDMQAREDRLISLVDLVFTGGRSMYEARKHKHPRVYCFPSGVDVEHYQQTRVPETKEPETLARIPHPRLGYFGVLDERIDWQLIATLAARRADWHWVLVGPTAKVEQEELPQAPNIHYLGQQPYADLPAFLKGFDIATMPFAINQATRFISPTKTLEYLAGGKPVISTSVPDVVASYQEIVQIADGADAWIERIDQTLAATEEQHAGRLVRAQDLLAQSSWDSIAARMWALMEDRLAEQGADSTRS